MGAFLGKFARFKAGAPHGAESWQTWMFYGLGVVATVVVTVWSTRIASRVLKSHVQV
jgi:hypothetical protein